MTTTSLKKIKISRSLNKQKHIMLSKRDYRNNVNDLLLTIYCPYVMLQPQAENAPIYKSPKVKEFMR